MLTRMCYQPWTSANVLADGQVYACCVVNKDMAISFHSSRDVGPGLDVTDGARGTSIRGVRETGGEGRGRRGCALHATAG